jgi:hypothetical protein
VKLVIVGRDYEWPEAPTYRVRRTAAHALGVTVNDLIDILTNDERTAEREEVYAALALVTAGEDASVVLDMHPGDIDIKVEPADVAADEGESLPPASSLDDAAPVEAEV